MNLLKLLTTAGVPLHQHEWDAYVSWVYNVSLTARRQQEHRACLGMPR